MNSLLAALISCVSEAPTPTVGEWEQHLRVSYILICKARKRCNTEGDSPVFLEIGVGSRQTMSLGRAVAVHSRTSFTAGQFKTKLQQSTVLQVGRNFMILCVPLCSSHPVTSRSGFVAHVRMLSS